MRIPFGVVVNKAMDEDQSIQQYCEQKEITVLMEIPYMREIAENYSNGVLPVQMDREWENKFVQLYYKIKGGSTS